MCCVNVSAERVLQLSLCLLLMFNVCVCASTLCDKQQLVWHKIGRRQNGYEIQLCCDVQSIWLAQATGAWALNASSAPKSVNEMTSWSDKFPIVICDNSSLIFGDFSPSDDKNCVQKMGSTIPLIFGTDVLPNNWYMVCYRLHNACQQCQFHKFCAEHFHPDCQHIWLTQDIDFVDNSSMHFRVRFGKDLPFTGSAQVRLYQQRLNGPSIQKRAWTMSARAKAAQNFGDDDLASDQYYVWSVCVHLVPTKSFNAQYGLHMLHEQTICAQNVTYKTLGGLQLGHYNQGTGHANIQFCNRSFLVLIVLKLLSAIL